MTDSTTEIKTLVYPGNIDEAIAQLDVDHNGDLPPVIVLLTGGTETMWTKEGTENTAHPERMSFPNLYRVIPTGKIALAQEKQKAGAYRLADIRYIVGCPSLDPKWQKENGYEPTPDNGDNIFIKNGTDTFLFDEADPSLYYYIRLYQGNKNNPFRPPSADTEYEEIIEREIAAAANTDFNVRLEALSLIGALQTKKTGGKIGYKYNESLIADYSKIFNLEEYESPEEKFQALVAIADADPERIINSIVNAKKSIQVIVKGALKSGVLKFTDDKVLDSKETVVLAFSGKLNDSDKYNKLMDFLSSADGEPFLNNIKIQVAKKEDELLSAKT